jgi:hypothetical protein
MGFFSAIMSHFPGAIILHFHGTPALSMKDRLA